MRSNKARRDRSPTHAATPSITALLGSLNAHMRSFTFRICSCKIISPPSNACYSLPEGLLPRISARSVRTSVVAWLPFAGCFPPSPRAKRRLCFVCWLQVLAGWIVRSTISFSRLRTSGNSARIDVEDSRCGSAAKPLLPEKLGSRRLPACST